MQENIKRKRRGAAMAALAILLIVAGVIAFIVKLLQGEEDAFVNGILWYYIGCGIAVVCGVILSLRQRFLEIQKGEEEESKIY